MAIGIDESSDIWAKAVTRWETATGEAMNAAKYRNMSMEHMTADALQSVARFEDNRHDKSKTSRVRQAFGKHIGDMQNVLSIFKLAGNAASLFPPALPAGILFSAAGRALEAFGMVSADYDEIEAFYNKLAKFFDHLLVIEKRAPNDEPFKRSVTLVFACQLDVLGIAHQYAGEKNPKRKRGLRLPHMPRTEKWLAALWDGQNPDLMTACTKMETAINDLRQLIGLETFSVVQDMFANQRAAMETQEAVKEELGEVKARLERINTAIRDKDFATEKGLGGIVAALGQVRADLKAQFDKPKTQIQQSAKTDVKDKGILAQNNIIEVFNESVRFADWDQARAQLRAEVKRASSLGVNLTCTWLTEDHSDYKAWVDGERPILFLSGNEGMGKTFLAHAMVNHLTSNDSARSIAHFCFREDSPNLQSKDNALACIVWQIARSNPRYCQLVAADLCKYDVEQSSWTRLVSKHFDPGSIDRLFLIIDGLDEMDLEQAVDLTEEITAMIAEGAKVSVLLTSRKQPPDSLDSTAFFEVRITKKEIWRDMTRLIEARCNSLSHLSTFPRKVRMQILRILRNRADDMLYIEHMLRRLDSIGRESAVLRDLKDAPKDLHALYSRMVLECHTNRNTEQSEALKYFFAWLAFSKRPLTLSEAGALMKELVQNGMYDIEEEIVGRSTRLLGVARGSNYDEEDGVEEDDDLDADELITDIDVEYLENGDNVLKFHERSLKEFFCIAESDSEGLRTPGYLAHLKIFLLTTKIMLESSTNSDTDNKAELLGYAAKYWADHFKELDMERLETGEFVTVVKRLYLVTSNTDLVPNLLEMYSDADKVYPGTRLTLDGTWLHNLEKVLCKASELPRGTLDVEIDEWIRLFMHDHRSVLHPLARGHLQNWIQGRSRSDICTAFGFLAAALDISISDLENIWNAINAILTTWLDLDISSNAMAHRAIATVLWTYGKLPRHKSEAMEWFSRACYMEAEDQDVERFHTLWLLAQLHNESFRWEEAIECMDRALASLPTNWGKDELLISTRRALFLAKAETFRDMNLVERAIDAYQEAKATSTLMPLASPDATSLNELLLLIWKQDSTGRDFLTCLHQLTEDERRKWLKYVITSNETRSADCISHFHEASKAEGATELSFLMSCYDDLESTLTPKSPDYFALRASKANAYEDVMHNTLKAKELYKEVLYSRVPEEGLNRVESTRSQVRNALAMLIFNEFRSSSDPLAKKSMLEEMKRLDDPHKSSLEPAQSNTDVMCALMLRTLGPSTDYQAYMDKTFKVCLTGIKDGVDWNDRSSFRLLAKVLACMEGLEQEALIALSCQFSRVDNTRLGSADDDNGGSSLTSETHADAIADTEISHSEQGIEVSRDVEGIKTSTENSAKLPVPQMPPECSAQDGSATTAEANEGPTADAETHGKTVEHENTERSAEDRMAAEVRKQRMYQKYLGSSAPALDVDGDITYEFNLEGVYCDGDCGLVQNKWKQDLYYCLVCADSDLCERCYQDRLAQNRGEETGTHWREYCGKDHRYIKGPIKGWRGVKDGVIRVEGREDVKFVDWLQNLEEVRWKEAWDVFWRRHGDVKDVLG